MPLRLRILLAILGLMVCLCAASALVYVLWPTETVREVTPVAPTLFAPPAAAISRAIWV